MEIGEQHVDRAEFVRRVDEDVSRAFARDHRQAARFEDARGRGADGDQPRGGVDFCGSLFADAETLGMHPMLGEVFRMDSAERADADVQREEGVRNLRENFRREMQPRSRRGDGSALAGKDRLITLRIRSLHFAIKVRRQRKFARCIEIDWSAKLNDPFALRANLHDDADHLADMHQRADPHFAPRLHETFPRILADHFEEEQLDAPIIGIDAGRDDARVVQHHEVARAHIAWEVAKAAMLDRLRLAMQHHHARVFAVRGRVPRDQFVGQRVIVIGSAQAHIAGRGRALSP